MHRRDLWQWLKSMMPEAVPVRWRGLNTGDKAGKVEHRRVENNCEGNYLNPGKTSLQQKKVKESMWKGDIEENWGFSGIYPSLEPYMLICVNTHVYVNKHLFNSD